MGSFQRNSDIKIHWFLLLMGSHWNPTKNPWGGFRLQASFRGLPVSPERPSSNQCILVVKLSETTGTLGIEGACSQREGELSEG